MLRFLKMMVAAIPEEEITMAEAVAETEAVQEAVIVTEVVIATEAATEETEVSEADAQKEEMTFPIDRQETKEEHRQTVLHVVLKAHRTTQQEDAQEEANSFVNFLVI